MSSITVLYGQPTPEELAAVVAVFVARASAAAPAHDALPGPPPRVPPSAWADRAAALRHPLTMRFTRPHSVLPPGTARPAWVRPS
jgi:hypothetical protein